MAVAAQPRDLNARRMKHRVAPPLGHASDARHGLLEQRLSARLAPPRADQRLDRERKRHLPGRNQVGE